MLVTATPCCRTGRSAMQTQMDPFGYMILFVVLWACIINTLQSFN